MDMDMGSSLLGTAWVVGLGILSIFALGDTVFVKIVVTLNFIYMVPR
jgi:hypothetical protein